MALAVIFVAVKGSFHDRVYASTSALSPELTQAQMMDINMLDGRGSGSTIPSPNLNTVQENSLVANRTVLATLDQGDDRTDVTTYEVQEGDVLSSIASDFGLSVQTLISANNLKNPNALAPGTQLNIPPIDGIIYTVRKGDTVNSLALKYAAESDKIITFNELPLGGELKAGQEIIIPDGVPAKDAPAKKGNQPTKNISNLRFLSLPQLAGYFITPATCRITQLLHVRNGIDCAAPAGTPIYAAAAGVVNLVKYGKSGYGNYVRITHPNDTETLYGHMRKIFVENGQTVAQGQQIGEMGSTGRSTGNHLHFEIHGAGNNLLKYGNGGSVVAGK